MSNAHMKLGKAKPKVDKRTLKLADYFEEKVELPVPPKELDWTKDLGTYGMMRNDELGDCAVAGPGHMIQTWSKCAAQPFTPTDEQIVKAYSDISGYDPESGENDDGCVLLDVMNYWKKTGIGGHKILGYAQVNTKDINEVMTAIYLFGGLNTGIALPITCQDQSIWSVVGDGKSGKSAPYSWGGHCVPIEAYNDNNPTCITWAKRLLMTWGFFETYCDEAYAVLSMDWLNNAKSPVGFDLDSLIADLAVIK